ncbi:PREDICTED: presqualene diphosphate phosphatase-like, partial [Buceros rhinoceros silvestris]|uniref:presqualene diphosphate phosphatase-like n=1 Tax=Buceros rhinoceros silvestris TaxID=175836 RepID=UPI0005281C09
LLLDLLLVTVLKGLVRRRRPTHNKMDMFFTISVDQYSFPSGHASRAALVCRFILRHLVLAVPLRVLVVLWALIVSLSRVMLGRHNMTDVLFGLLLGYVLPEDRSEVMGAEAQGSQGRGEGMDINKLVWLKCHGLTVVQFPVPSGAIQLDSEPNKHAGGKVQGCADSHSLQ